MSDDPHEIRAATRLFVKAGAAALIVLGLIGLALWLVL
jgi:hypothetical protein